MTDITRDEPQQVADERGASMRIADGVQMLVGCLAGIRGPSHATSQGELDDYNDEVGMFLAGLSGRRELGDSSASPRPRGSCDLGAFRLKRITVTGVTGRGDILKPFYFIDNNPNAATLTRPTTGEAAGIIIEHVTGTTVDVLVFSADARAAADTRTELLYLGSVDFATLADGNIKTGIPAPFHGVILEVFTITEVALVGSGGTSQLNLEIGGTDVTGGVITVSTAAGATLGTKLAGTAITAAAEFHEGDAIDVEAASTGGTRTSGSVGLFAKVQRLPGA